MNEVLAIISTVISVLSFLGVGTVIGLFIKSKFEKKQKKDEKNEQLIETAKKQELIQTIETALDTKLRPVQEEIASIKSDMQNIKHGVQASNRTDLEDLFSRVYKAGYCTDYDKKRFDYIYSAYHNLGKNGVMDGKYKQIMAMPELPPKKRKAKLNETKIE